MQSLILNFKLMPKPRGNLGRYGNIVHSTPKYLEFQKKIFESIDNQLAVIEPISYQFYIGVFYQYMIGKGSGKGSKGDIDNLMGGIIDCIVKSKIFVDDSMKYWEGQKMRSNPGSSYKTIILIGKLYEIEEIDKTIDELKNQSLINSLSNINRTVDLRYKLRK